KNANKTSRGGIAAFRESLTIGPGSCRRFFLVRRSSSGTPCLQPSCRLGPFLRNFPKKCRVAFFRFRRKIVLDELPQPSQFRIQLLAYLFELVHGVFLNPCKLRVCKTNPETRPPQACKTSPQTHLHRVFGARNAIPVL